MALTNNPTKTRTIEKNWYRDINKRWSLFSSRIIGRFQELANITNHAGVITNKAVGMDLEQLRIYMAYVEAQINNVLLGSPSPRNWQNQYQLEAYFRAYERTRSALLSMGGKLAPTRREQVIAQGLGTFSATPSLATSAAVLGPIHTEGLEFIYTRAYNSLNGWTNKMSTEVRQIAFDAIKNGTGVVQTTRLIRERIGVSKSRAELIASTETISAYREASIAEVENAEEELGEEIPLRWITARDSRVRHLHAKWHGTKASAKETRKRGNKSPYRCRCSQIPVIEGVSDTEEKEAKFTSEREALLAAEKIKEGKAKKAKAATKKAPAKTKKTGEIKKSEPKAKAAAKTKKTSEIKKSEPTAKAASRSRNSRFLRESNNSAIDAFNNIQSAFPNAAMPSSPSFRNTANYRRNLNAFDVLQSEYYINANADDLLAFGMNSNALQSVQGRAGKRFPKRAAGVVYSSPSGWRQININPALLTTETLQAERARSIQAATASNSSIATIVHEFGHLIYSPKTGVNNIINDAHQFAVLRLKFEWEAFVKTPLYKKWKDNHLLELEANRLSKPKVDALIADFRRGKISREKFKVLSAKEELRVEKLLAKKHSDNFVSMYAYTNDSELIAESFAAYKLGGKNIPKIARVIGEMIDRTMKK